ncbi:hypothetical protein ACFX15_023773 [Malus domestica]
MNYLNWDMQFMLGLAVVASVRVSNELGAGHAKVAKFSVFVVNGTSILISIIFTAIILIFRVALSKLFTSHDEVITAISNLTPLLAISVFLNGIQPILSGLAAELSYRRGFLENLGIGGYLQCCGLRYTVVELELAKFGYS